MAQHHWPTWGNENVVNLLKSQRDLYRYINDQTLRMANEGLTRDEIAANFKLPNSWPIPGPTEAITVQSVMTSKPPTCSI